MSSNPLQLADPGQKSGASVEMWFQPARIWEKSTFLAFCDPGKPFKLSFRQSEADLKIRVAKNEFSVRHFFRNATPVFLTITAGADGTAVYVNGSLVRIAGVLRLSPVDFTGHMVVGDSPGQGDSWQGQLYGLAIYHRELKRSEIARNYEAWTQTGRPETSQPERNVALFLLNERSGGVAHNAAASGPDLLIPARYTVFDQIFLEPFWQEFNLSWSYWSAALKNIIGFVPLGFCFYAWFTVLRLRRAAIATVALGTAVSLIIEVLQGWLPTRNSGTTDLFTNTLGTWIGVVAYRVIGPALTSVLSVATVSDAHDLRD